MPACSKCKKADSIFGTEYCLSCIPVVKDQFGRDVIRSLDRVAMMTNTMTPDQPPERRLMRFRIAERAVLELAIYGCRCFPQFVYRLKHPSLHDDVEVVAVHHVHECGAFDFLLRHPSFAVVPHGEMIPLANDALKVEYEAVEVYAERRVAMLAAGLNIGKAMERLKADTAAPVGTIQDGDYFRPVREGEKATHLTVDPVAKHLQNAIDRGAEYGDPPVFVAGATGEPR